MNSHDSFRASGRPRAHRPRRRNLILLIPRAFSLRSRERRQHDYQCVIRTCELGETIPVFRSSPNTSFRDPRPPWTGIPLPLPLRATPSPRTRVPFLKRSNASCDFAGADPPVNFKHGFQINCAANLIRVNSHLISHCIAVPVGAGHRKRKGERSVPTARGREGGGETLRHIASVAARETPRSRVYVCTRVQGSRNCVCGVREKSANVLRLFRGRGRGRGGASPASSLDESR